MWVVFLNHLSYTSIACSSEGCLRTSFIITFQEMSSRGASGRGVAKGGFVRTIFAVISASIFMMAEDSDLAATVLSSRRVLKRREDVASWFFSEEISDARALSLALKSVTMGASFLVNKSFSWSWMGIVSSWLDWVEDDADEMVRAWLEWVEEELDTRVREDGVV